MDEKRARTWQKAGSGDPPLCWNLQYWPDAVADADILTPVQYWHVADQLCELARAVEPARCETLNIASFDKFWSLEDKGGVLGKINLRVFFVTNPNAQSIVVLGIHKKEDERQLRRSVVVRIERRVRHYLTSLRVGKKGESR